MKALIALYVLCVLVFSISVGLLVYNGLIALQKCNPAVVHETRDGKDLTTLGCVK